MAKIKKVQAVQTNNYPMVSDKWACDKWANGITKFKTSAIKYAHTVKAAKLANDMANYQALAIQAAQNEMAGIKPSVIKTQPIASKLNCFGNSKGYGDKAPKQGTSAYLIWQACEHIGITQTSVTKLYIDEINNMSLICANGKPVNYNNISIEINSFKKYLKNHNI